MVAVHNTVVYVWCVVDVPILRFPTGHAHNELDRMFQPHAHHMRLPVGHTHTEMERLFRAPHHVVTETGDRADNRTETGDPTDNRIGSMNSTIFTPSYIFDDVD